MWVRGTLREYLSICEGSLKTLVLWEQELRRVWVWERYVICVWLWVCAYKFWEGECRFCVRERGSEETVRSKTLLCLGGAHVRLFCCVPCVCVSDSTLRSYPHGSGIVFITTAMIHHTANEKQQAGPEQASPLCTLGTHAWDGSGWATSAPVWLDD